jgi:hypothetical protein
MRQADVQAVLASVSPRVAAKAMALIEDNALVPLNHRGAYRAVADDGHTTYITHPAGCTCQAGLHSMRCSHSVAAQILELRRAA